MPSLLDPKVTGVQNPFNVAVAVAEQQRATERNAFNLILKAFQGMDGEDQAALSQEALSNPQFSAFLDRQGVPEGFGPALFRPFNPTAEDRLHTAIQLKEAGMALPKMQFDRAMNSQGQPVFVVKDPATGMVGPAQFAGQDQFTPILPSGSELTVDPETGKVTFRSGGIDGVGSKGAEIPGGITQLSDERLAAALGITVQEARDKREAVSVGEKVVKEIEELLSMSKFVHGGIIGNLRELAFDIGAIVGVEVFPDTPEFRNRLEAVRVSQLRALNEAVDDRRFHKADRDEISDIWGDINANLGSELKVKSKLLAILSVIDDRTRINAGIIGTEPVYRRTLLDLLSAPHLDVTDPRFLTQERVELAIEHYPSVANEFQRWMRLAEQRGVEIKSIFKVKD